MRLCFGSDSASDNKSAVFCNTRLLRMRFHWLSLSGEVIWNQSSLLSYRYLDNGNLLETSATLSRVTAPGLSDTTSPTSSNFTLFAFPFFQIPTQPWIGYKALEPSIWQSPSIGPAIRNGLAIGSSP